MVSFTLNVLQDVNPAWACIKVSWGSVWHWLFLTIFMDSEANRRRSHRHCRDGLLFTVPKRRGMANHATPGYWEWRALCDAPLLWFVGKGMGGRVGATQLLVWIT